MTNAASSATPPPRLRYGFLGPAATFTESALRQVASPSDHEFMPFTSVILALEALESGDLDAAVVPIENSVEGGVPATLDALRNSRGLRIVREMLVPIEFALAVDPGQRLEDITRVASHPHGHAQCRVWIAHHLPHVSVEPATSTAGAAAMIAADRERGLDVSGRAALCSPLAAEQYGLEVLANAADNLTAVTRFVLVARTATHPLPQRTGQDKTSLVVHLPSDKPGALLDMLEQFVTNGVNLSRLESRPIGDAMGRYLFSIDADGHVLDERVAEALVGLHRVCPKVQFLGSYPRAAATSALIPGENSDEAYARARAWVENLRGAR
ncbi:prephenate dehydratase [Micrococcales bacterium 31B]|nr:prephenate dehydratase [Micrococcales bacterium 31B]